MATWSFSSATLDLYLNPICYFFVISGGLISALAKVGKALGPKAKSPIKNLEGDVTAVNSAAKSKNGLKTKAALNKSAKDLNAAAPLAAKYPKLAKSAKKLAAQVKAFAAKFSGSKGPFAKVPGLTSELTKKVQAKTPK